MATRFVVQAPVPAVDSVLTLRTLDLSVNSLKQLPSLAPLSRLKTLKLQGNKLVALPDLTCLPALLDLNAARNELGLGGDAVPCLPTTLSKLDLSSNKLSQVPAALAAGLPALQICNLSSNAITSLAGLGGLPALEELLADDNQIAVIEPSIRELRRLKTLSLRSNCIGSDLSRGQPLAQELFECTAVVVLNLEGNVITKTQLLDMQGVSKFMERRERSKDKSLAGGALLNFSLCGLD
ncbi:hypothetical protein JKP88DRAFT_270600 [Tribonema minus]|uniref:Leucine-rich repeat-containing protein 57 n=1 Tax=Tribonema minus TaxID=303371 RepID=A0A836CA00_9STRA|nr:hypothetical protein JKP88DRAFT_270600 [Tribonema minus]